MIEVSHIRFINPHTLTHSPLKEFRGLEAGVTLDAEACRAVIYFCSLAAVFQQRSGNLLGTISEPWGQVPMVLSSGLKKAQTNCQGACSRNGSDPQGKMGQKLRVTPAQAVSHQQRHRTTVPGWGGDSNRLCQESQWLWKISASEVSISSSWWSSYHCFIMFDNTPGASDKG